MIFIEERDFYGVNRLIIDFIRDILSEIVFENDVWDIIRILVGYQDFNLNVVYFLVVYCNICKNMESIEIIIFRIKIFKNICFMNKWILIFFRVNYYFNGFF